MREAEEKSSNYHIRAFWLSDREADKLYKLSDLWYDKWLYWSNLLDQAYLEQEYNDHN